MIPQPKIVFLSRSLRGFFSFEGAEERLRNTEARRMPSVRQPNPSFPFPPHREGRFGDLLLLELPPLGQRFHRDWLGVADLVLASQLDKAAGHRL